jgi:glycerate-2-kinase
MNTRSLLEGAYHAALKAASPARLLAPHLSLIHI